VTDANVLLGRLHPTYLLGGRMPIDLSAAEEAITRLAGTLRLDRADAARGILAVVESNMLRAVRVVSVERGRDPRDFALLAFGGAGPLHAAALAAELGVGTVLVPPQPGILCALGLLVEDLRTDYVRTRVLPLEPGLAPTLAAEFGPLESAARAWLEREGVQPAQRTLERQLEMRYAGQNYELPVPCGDGTPDVTRLRQAFLLAHRHAYGYAAEDEPIQVVNLRVRAVGHIAPLPWASEPPVEDPDPGPARVGARGVYFDAAGGFVETPLYGRDRLRAGHRIAGPAIVEQMDSTTVLAPGQTAHVHSSGTLIITVPPR
jgi:N-methylhydantoinase A